MNNELTGLEFSASFTPNDSETGEMTLEVKYVFDGGVTSHTMRQTVKPGETLHAMLRGELLTLRRLEDEE